MESFSSLLANNKELGQSTIISMLENENIALEKQLDEANETIKRLNQLIDAKDAQIKYVNDVNRKNLALIKELRDKLNRSQEIGDTAPDKDQKAGNTVTTNTTKFIPKLVWSNGKVKE